MDSVLGYTWVSPPLPFLGLSPSLGRGVLLGAEKNKVMGEVMLLIRRE